MDIKKTIIKQGQFKQRLSEVAEVIRKHQPIHIAEICNKLGRPRSSVLHYLNFLEGQGVVVKKRCEKEYGRPTKYQINPDMTEVVEEDNEFYLKVIKEMLSKIIKDGEMTQIDFQRYFMPSGTSKENDLRLQAMMDLLMEFDNGKGSWRFTDKIIRVNEKGMKFLKEQKI